MVGRQKWPVRATKLLGSVALVAAVALGGFVIEQSVSSARQAQQRLQHSYEVVDQIASLRISALRLQGVIHRALARNSAGDWEAVRAGRDVMDLQVTRLSKLIRSNPDQLSRLHGLIAGIESRRAAIDRLRRLSPEAKERATLTGSTEDNKAVASPIATLNSLEGDERRLLLARAASDRISSAHTNQVMLALFVGAILTSTLAFTFLVTQLDGNLKRHAELRRAKDETDALNRALLKGEARLQAILENAQDAIVVASGKGQVRLANAACERLFGARREELLGRHIDELLPGIEIGAEDLRSMTARRLDGSEFPAELSVGSYEPDGEDGRIVVLRDITERHRLDRLKAEFISTVSHELRTPLTSIKASLGLLAAGSAGQVPEKARGLVKIAHKNSVRLANLVNDLLDIDRIESERSRLNEEIIDLSSIVRRAVEESADLAAERDVVLRHGGPPGDLPAVSGDRRRLVQALSNLISNAVKFSPRGGRVDVWLRSGAGEAELSVRDFGPGIEESFRPRVFSRFSQADSSDVRRNSGTGLGLSITRAIVQRHGGRIGFESPLRDGGSRFWFTLPLASGRAAAGETMAQGSTPAADGSADATQRCPTMAAQESPQTAIVPDALALGPSDARWPETPRALYVEDDADMVAVVTAILAPIVEIVPARSLGEARARLREERFALAIIDVALPDGSGYELVHPIRGLPAPPPILVLSATECEEAYAGLVSAAMVKGHFDHEELLRTVRTLLQSRPGTGGERATDEAGRALPAGVGSAWPGRSPRAAAG